MKSNTPLSIVPKSPNPFQNECSVEEGLKEALTAADLMDDSGKRRDIALAALRKFSWISRELPLSLLVGSDENPFGLPAKDPNTINMAVLGIKFSVEFSDGEMLHTCDGTLHANVLRRAMGMNHKKYESFDWVRRYNICVQELKLSRGLVAPPTIHGAVIKITHSEQLLNIFKREILRRMTLVVQERERKNGLSGFREFAEQISKQSKAREYKALQVLDVAAALQVELERPPAAREVQRELELIGCRILKNKISEICTRASFKLADERLKFTGSNPV